MSNITLRWSTYEIAKEEADRLVEEEEMDEDEAFEQACGDSDLTDQAWEDLCSGLTEEMQKINPHDREWKAEVNNFGWDHRDGWKNFRASTGVELLREVLPDTECTFTISFDFRKHLITINNAHHDAPMGGEMYYIRPMTAKEEGESYR